jgi:hypothetical protein
VKDDSDYSRALALLMTDQARIAREAGYPVGCSQVCWWGSMCPHGGRLLLGPNVYGRPNRSGWAKITEAWKTAIRSRGGVLAVAHTEFRDEDIIYGSTDQEPKGS